MSKKYDKFSSVTNIASRVCYFFRWLFDNGYVLCKIGFGPRKYTIGLKITSGIFWLFALSFYLVYCIITIRKTYNDESDLKVAAVEFMTVRQMRENLKKIG